MRRREFIAAIGATALASIGPRANDPIPVVGVLSGGTEQEDDFRVDAFRGASVMWALSRDATWRSCIAAQTGATITCAVLGTRPPGAHLNKNF